jgi:SWI/SNF-related matrix-associated actin-dependent regulator of chromatin subfamily A3
MIQGLLDEQALNLFVSCTLHDDTPARRGTRVPLQVPCTLDVTVYGPLDIFEEIGTWFQEYEVYLQDPLTCHLDVKYCNPQRLSSGDIDTCPMVSQVVSQTNKLPQLQDVPERPDLLGVLSGHSDLEETTQPGVIRAELKR